MRNLLLRCSLVYMKQITCIFIAVFIHAIFFSAVAQPGAEIELKKPERYENRRLGAEKTGEKKFTLPRRILSNTTTHYNYYFNANTRLNDVVEKAKASHKDDYSQLLPFYNYSLETTSQDKVELDSIIYKSTAGILLHDLRNDWIDNMYLVLAKAYFFRNDMDSAGMTLQYINYAFAPKEDGGYDIPIGSNASNETGEFSIASKENKGLKKIITHQPSRNESFLWQVRTFIEKEEYPEAAGIMEILRNDPQFPKRLKTELDETLAYWFYKQQLYDSSAHYLTLALSEASNGQEKARWEYLIAQMYHLSGNYDNAVKFYNRAIKHTADPVMDVYARLNSIKINRGDDKDYLQRNIDALVKMARRDKYINYRDIIYFAAAAIELERNNFDNAQNLLLKSVASSTENPVQKNRSFLLLADMNYNRKNYNNAHRFYDSIDVNTLVVSEEKSRVELRKPPLKLLADNDAVIYKNDSLQHLASMPANERDDVLRKLVRRLRKEQGLKDEDVGSSNPAIRQQAPDLFGSSTKGNDFYFYNASQKATGFNEFRGKWGDRPNIDNWRRQAAVNKRSFANATELQDPGKPLQDEKKEEEPLSYESMLASLPLTDEAMKQSNSSIAKALFDNATILINKLEDYPSAIQLLEEFLRRFPDDPNTNEAMFNLVYAYEKTGDKAKADQYRNRVLQAGKDNKFAQLLANANAPKVNEATNAATKKYEDIYNLFIEGRFEEAKNEKRVADSTYGKNFWTPQLLYIEAIYYVKQKEDSAAIKILTDLATLHDGSALAPKARTMVNVLKRRSEIENYLTNLEVTANVDASSTQSSQVSQPVKQDTKPVTQAPAQQQPMAQQPVTQKSQDNAVAVAPDTSAKTNVAVETPKIIGANSFAFIPSEKQYVVVLLDKVDEVYANEARNAFNRYNRETFYNQKIEQSSLKLDDRYHMMLQGPFENAGAAINYIDKVKPIAKGRILPWLAADKYSFILISQQNLDLLKTNKDINAYQQLLKQAFPDKF